MVDLWSSGCTIPTPIHFEDFVCSDEPKIIVQVVVNVNLSIHPYCDMSNFSYHDV